MDSGYAEYTHLLDEMEYEVAHHYRKAERELTAKVEKYYKDFARLDAKKQADVNAGKITEAEYREWRKNKLLSGKVWEQRKDTIAKDLYNANYIARNLIGEGLPDVYAIGHNFATYQIEQAARVNTSYVLYNHEAVERLIADNPDLIPYQQINFAKDIAWNKRNLQALMIQGILQGESIPHLAKRVPKTIIKRNRECTIRNARTMATSAYNGGKMDAFNRAKRLGIDMKVRWRATFDDRTRDSHRALDGEVREVGEAFSNGLTFPCDMSWLKDAGHGLDAKVVDVFREKCAETYNCRCTIQGVVGGFESRALKYRSNEAVGIPYEEWKKGHKYADDVRAGKIKPKASSQKPIKTPLKPAETKKANPVKTQQEKAIEKGKLPKYVNKGNINDIKEYLQNTLGLDMINVSENTVSPVALDLIAKEITDAYNIFGNIHEKGALWAVLINEQRADYYAAYNPRASTLIFSKSKLKAKNALRTMRKTAIEQNKAGFWSTSETAHSIRHEIGHSIEKMYAYDTKNPIHVKKLEKIEALRQQIKDDIGITNWSMYDSFFNRYEAGGRLSYYGLMDNGEFIAESVAEYMAGNPRETAKKVVEILLEE